MIIYTDNKASKRTIENGEINSKLKHINIHYHYNIDNILKNKIKLEYINTANMLADPLTKDLHGTKMSEFTNKIFVKNIWFEGECEGQWYSILTLFYIYKHLFMFIKSSVLCTRDFMNMY